MNETAFEEIYVRMRLKIFRYILFRIKDRSLSEDITSDVFVKLYKELQSKPEIKRYVDAWCYRVSSNLLIDRLRSKGYQRTVTLSELEAHDDSREIESIDEKNEDLLISSIREEKQRKIWQAISTLPNEERELVHLRMLEELPFHQIAVILNKKEGAVKMRFKRIINKLQRIIKES